MKWFQLDPQSIVARSNAAQAPVQIPTLAQSLLRGSAGFMVVSVAGFIPWMLAGAWFYRNPSELFMYSCCAAIFIALSGVLLHPLIIGPGSWLRFYQFFSVAFAAYSAAWIVGWMGLRGQHMHVRSVAGLFAGTVVMGMIFSSAFEAPGARLKIIAALFVLNSLGYFIGGVIEEYLKGLNEFNLLLVRLSGSALAVFMKAAWGVCYGIGLGAGLGYAFYTAQEQARQSLSGRAR